MTYIWRLFENEINVTQFVSVETKVVLPPRYGYFERKGRQ